MELRLAARDAVFDERKLRADAIVFAAHGDDETLGCGGTIARKVAAGARIHVVVMTDGRQSHPEQDGERLVAMRREETLAAAAALGLPPASVTFFDFPDGELTAHIADASARLQDLLAMNPSDQIFVPYSDDGHPDHEATYLAVMSALGALKLRADVFEYPIWAWLHWPWVRLDRPTLSTLGPWLATLKFGFGHRFTRIFTVSSPCGEHLPRKLAALAAHETQLGNAVDDKSWSLARLNGGGFLERFQAPVEVFRRSSTDSQNGV